MDEAATVGEVIAIPLDVRETQTHLCGGQGRDVLGGRKALASPSVPLQDVLLVLEGAHLVDDGRLVDTTLYFGQLDEFYKLVWNLWRPLLRITLEVHPMP